MRMSGTEPSSVINKVFSTIVVWCPHNAKTNWSCHDWLKKPEVYEMYINIIHRKFFLYKKNHTLFDKRIFSKFRFSGLSDLGSRATDM